MDDQTAISKNKEEKKTKINPINRLGEYAIKGGPGRPAGMKNKFTLLKEQMVDVWSEENGKEKFREFFGKEFARALDKIIAIMPHEEKESSTENHFHLTVFNFDSNKRDNNSSSRVHGIDSPMAK